jgi:predicted dehydrogenase
MTIRYGIIGSGRMGNHHAEQLKSIPDAEIVAVCDAHLPTAETLGKRVNATVYSDYQEMLEKEQLDAVYLCTPVRGRLEQVKAITAKKVNLYIEKPLAVSIEEAEKICQLIEESRIICTIGFQWRSMDFVKKAKEIMGDEPISLLSGRYYWTVPIVEWIQTRHLGGGQIFDQNIHMVDLSTFFAGEVDYLFSAFTQKATVGEMENWDGYSTTASFKNQTVGNFYSTYALYPTVGEEPFLDIIQKNRLLRITQGKLTVKTPGKEEVFFSQEKVAGINQDFHIALAENDPSKILAPIRDGLHTLKVVHAANNSAIDKQVVYIKELKNFGLDDLQRKYVFND